MVERQIDACPVCKCERYHVIAFDCENKIFPMNEMPAHSNRILRFVACDGCGVVRASGFKKPNGAVNG